MISLFYTLQSAHLVPFLTRRCIPSPGTFLAPKNRKRERSDPSRYRKPNLASLPPSIINHYIRHIVIPWPPQYLALPFCAFLASCCATNPDRAVPSISTPLLFIPPLPPPPAPRLVPPPLPPPPVDRLLSSSPFPVAFMNPAPSAADATLTPLGPVHGPGSDRIVSAASDPA